MISNTQVIRTLNVLPKEWLFCLFVFSLVLFFPEANWEPWIGFKQKRNTTAILFRIRFDS